MKARQSQKNLKPLLLLIPIFAVLAISGCTQGGGVSFGNGVQILNWEPDFSSVYSGDQVQLRLRIQNKGEVTAERVSAMLSGITIDDWNVQAQSQFGGFGNNVLDFSNLNPPNRVENVDSAPVEGMFRLTAPNLPKGATQQYTPQIRVYYRYKTTAIKSLTFVNENELRRLQDQGKTLSSGETTVSAGPLGVVINTGKFVKSSETTGISENVLPLTIEIQNKGGGVVSTEGDRTGQNDYKVGFRLTIPSRMSVVKCNNIEGFGGFGGGEVSGNVNLWKGSTAAVTCTFRITNPPLTSEQGDIKVLLYYDYYVDSQTTITVTGTSENYNPGWY